MNKKPFNRCKDRGAYNYSSKVVLVGDSSVGKTNLLLRLVNQQYNMSHSATIGVDLKIKTIFAQDKKIRMQIWDTAGQERFRTITNSYFKDTAGIILVYSITDRKTFQNLDYWFQIIQDSGVQDGTVLMLVGNKCDDVSARQVSQKQAQQLANKHGYLFKQVSAKQNINVQQIFQIIGQKVIEHIQTFDQKQSSFLNESLIVIKNTQQDIKNKCCN